MRLYLSGLLTGLGCEFFPIKVTVSYIQNNYLESFKERIRCRLLKWLNMLLMSNWVLYGHPTQLDTCHSCYLYSFFYGLYKTKTYFFHIRSHCNSSIATAVFLEGIASLSSDKDQHPCLDLPHTHAQNSPTYEHVGVGQWSTNMETFMAPHIFIELTLSEKLLGASDHVCSTRFQHSVMYLK